MLLERAPALPLRTAKLELDSLLAELNKVRGRCPEEKSRLCELGAQIEEKNPQQVRYWNTKSREFLSDGVCRASLLSLINRQAKTALNRGTAGEADQLYQLAIDLPVYNVAQKYVRAEVLTSYARALAARRPADVEKLLLGADKLYEEIGDRKTQAQNFQLLATSIHQTNPDHALSFSLKAANLFAECSDTSGRRTSLQTALSLAQSTRNEAAIKSVQAQLAELSP